MVNLSKIKVLNTFIFASLLLLIFLAPNKYEPFSEAKNFTYSCIVLVNVLFFLYTMTFYFQSWIRYDTLFIIGFLIVHFQIPFLASIGSEPPNPSFIWIDKFVVNYATWLSSIVILTWFIGFNLSLNRNFNKILKAGKKEYIIDFKWLDNLLAGLFFIFIIVVGSEFLSGSYDGGSNWGTGTTYVYLIFRICLFLRIIYFFVNNKAQVRKKKYFTLFLQNKIFLSVFFTFFCIFLLSGDRGLIMQLGLLVLGCYAVFVRKISFKLLIVLLLLGSTLFTLIRFGRSGDVNMNVGSNVVERGLDNFQSSDTDFNPTHELASSVRIQYRALSDVPDRHPYLYGSTVLFNIIGVIPFGSSVYISLTDLPLMYQSSTYFFTIMGQGMFFSSGEGSEIVGDLYINFGVLGVIFIMFSFGFFISHATLTAFYKRDLVLTIVFLILLTSAIYVNRAPFLAPLKDIVYALVLNKIFARKIVLR